MPAWCGCATSDTKRAATQLRVRVEIVGLGKYEHVGESQSVLILINPIIFTRTRMRRQGRTPKGGAHGQGYGPPPPKGWPPQCSSGFTPPCLDDHPSREPAVSILESVHID
jgi:hypothetical protein